jgi:hypothetical protein
MDPNKKEIQFSLNLPTKSERKNNRSSKSAPVKGEPNYGCLKNGKIPTYKQFTRRSSLQTTPRSKGPTTTYKHYRKCGKIQKNTVRVLLADQKMVNGIEKDKKKLEKHSLATVCDYLAKRNLYSAGSDVPEDILRETYKNAHLAGNVHNHDSDIMINNFLKGESTSTA